jgi:hypothetical protein
VFQAFRNATPSWKSDWYNSLNRTGLSVTDKSAFAHMDKSLLSQILDGAAFPAMMLAVAVSQIKVGPHQRNSLHQEERLAAELQVGDRVEKTAKQLQGH